jgi:hypothetical protein
MHGGRENGIRASLRTSPMAGFGVRLEVMMDGLFFENGNFAYIPLLLQY